MIIGVIGGGQLGMMIAEAAIELGHEIVSLDPNPNCSISRFSKTHLAYDYNDKIGINKMINLCDVITYEFENVNAEVIQDIEVKLPQRVEALKTSQNRLKEKQLAKSLNIPTPNFKKYVNIDDIFIPAIIKSVTGGYDGKGQFKIMDKSINFEKSITDRDYIIEEYINFDYEISVIASRDKYKEVVFYPIPRNIHKKGILFTSTAFNDVPEKIQKHAKMYTKKLVESLNYIGTIAVEFFVKDNEVIFNEFAPRPHNSGHYTIEGCNVSQFKNHILAITNQHVIEPKLMHKTIMINVIGENLDFYKKAKQIKEAYLHDYFKKEIRAERKMGHITIVSDDCLSCLNKKVNIIGESNDK